VCFFFLFFFLVKPRRPTIAQPNPDWEGQNATLTCVTVTTQQGNNYFTFTWFKDGVTLSGETASVFFKTVLASDAGNYSCAVTYLGVTSDVSNPVTLKVFGRFYA
jgi:hypothetical protein